MRTCAAARASHRMIPDRAMADTSRGVDDGMAKKHLVDSAEIKPDGDESMLCRTTDKPLYGQCSGEDRLCGNEAMLQPPRRRQRHCGITLAGAQKVTPLQAIVSSTVMSRQARVKAVTDRRTRVNDPTPIPL